MNLLEVKNISKEFKISKKQKQNLKTNLDVLVAVNNLSFSVSSGTIYGLLGPNGAGKTTTLRIIASLIEAKNGEVLFNHKNIKEDIYSYRKQIGFLTSELKLDDFFTPDYTFTYMSKLYGVKDEEINENKKRIFAQFGVDKFKDVKIKELSTGMKQKISLAVSICHNPDIIIFDEPTNGLDVVASRDVENFLLEMKNQNKIIIISTHIFSLVEKLCDEVGIIVDGKLLVDAPLKELTKDDNLENTFFKLYEEVNQNEKR